MYIGETVGTDDELELNGRVGIRFETTSSFTQMFISQAGNVGINTTSPTSTLQVQGTLNVSGGQGASALYVADTGRVGIGTTSPESPLKVSGNINATGSVFANNQNLSLPKGVVMFFNLSACPQGWSEMVPARGLYIVGLPASGTLSATVGTALTDTENRPTGSHNHTIRDPGHTHTYLISNNAQSDCGVRGGDACGASTSTSSGTTGIIFNATTNNTASMTSGTNAPYIQLLVCVKD